jgi:hypothetical protein
MLRKIEEPKGEKPMKKFFLTICLMILCLTTTARAVEQKAGKDASAQDSLPDTPSISLKEKLPELNKIFADKPEPAKMLARYAAFVLKPDIITTESHLKAIFQLRNSVITEINEPVSEYMMQAEQNQTLTDKLIAELKSVGMQGVYAEGMFVALTAAPVLESKISKIASEPFKLYLQLMQHHADSMGGEYPYMNLTKKMKTLQIGELLRKKYPDSEYVTESYEPFAEALRTLTDVHKLAFKDHAQYIIGALSTDFYPTGTEPENYKKFISEYPQSRFNDVVKKIVSDMSEIRMKQDGHFDRLYLVVTDEPRDFETGQKMVFGYLMNGTDIPHLVQVKQGLFVVYRFYSDEAKARQALDTIKKTKPGAKIVMIDESHILRHE